MQIRTVSRIIFIFSFYCVPCTITTSIIDPRVRRTGLPGCDCRLLPVTGHCHLHQLDHLGSERAPRCLVGPGPCHSTPAQCLHARFQGRGRNSVCTVQPGHPKSLRGHRNVRVATHISCIRFTGSRQVATDIYAHTINRSERVVLYYVRTTTLTN